MRFVTPLTVALLSLALGGSLLLNLWLYGSTHRYYTNLQRLHLDPLGLSAYPTTYPTSTSTTLNGPDPQETTVVLLGDSRAYSWPLEIHPSVKVINRGINGQTTGQILGRTQAHLQDINLQVVVIQMGINDLKMIPLFPDQERAIIDNCKNNLLNLIGEVHGLGAIVVVTTLFPLGSVPWERRLVWSDRVDLAIAEVNDFIRSLDSPPDVQVFDAAKLLQQTASPRIQPQYSEDLLHLNAAGYDRLNTDLIPLLQYILNLSAPPSDEVLPSNYEAPPANDPALKS